MSDAFVSILMLTHNAPDYVRIAVESVRERTEGVAYELVVVDNASDPATIVFLEELKARGLIDRLVLSPVNTLFAGGNNIAAREANPAATHFLLLNSDVEAHDPRWLRDLLDVHETPGIAAYGIAEHAPLRVDGYCLLIDAPSYRDRGGLDEGFQWWWSVTRLQAGMLADGHSVKGYWSHDDKLVHFGGKSGDAFTGAAGMTVSRDEVIGWFKGREPTVLDAAAMRRESFSRQLRRGMTRGRRMIGMK